MHQLPEQQQAQAAATFINMLNIQPKMLHGCMQCVDARYLGVYCTPWAVAPCLDALQVEVSQTLCCLAIPADMSVAHFCTFIGAYLGEVRSIQVGAWGTAQSYHHITLKCNCKGLWSNAQWFVSRDPWRWFVSRTPATIMLEP